MATIQHYDIEWVYPYEKERKHNKLISEGYKVSSWNENQYIKVTDIKSFASECNPVWFSNAKGNDDRYCTKFYEIKRSEYEALVEKPELVDVCRPLELTNYDWYCADVTANERRGKGWEECYIDYIGCHRRNVYFVVD